MTESPQIPSVELLNSAAQAIRSAKSIVFACHVNPDGDALGSMLGLVLGLAPLAQDLTVLSQDSVPDILQFLPGVERVQGATERERFDLAVVLDSGDLQRVGADILPVIARADKVIDIDHHAVSGAFGDIQVLNALAASTSEIVYALLQVLDLPITPEVATCLFTGVITDTGSFRFQNVTPNTFRVAAALLNAGAPPAHISENVFENRTFAATQLLGRALSGLRQTEDGRVVWAKIAAADFADTGAGDEDSEGFVNYARGVRGAKVGILLREISSDSIRVSLRSHESVNVAEIAATFQGGGHRMASGLTYNGSLADAERDIIAAVVDALPRD